MEEKIV